MKLSVREICALLVLLRGPIMREGLDAIVGCSNGPDLVLGLRRKGLEVPCDRLNRLDKYGRLCRPGQYRLTPDDKSIVHAWLSSVGNENGRQAGTGK